MHKCEGELRSDYYCCQTCKTPGTVHHGAGISGTHAITYYRGPSGMDTFVGQELNDGWRLAVVRVFETVKERVLVCGVVKDEVFCLNENCENAHWLSTVEEKLDESVRPQQ